MTATLSSSEHRRADQLVVAKRRATGLLVLAAAVFVVAAVLQSRAHWLGWVEATAIASLVGGLADWFAVTALFRRPLGLPIPHTAIVVERKDRFAETLGTFVQENFLSPAAVTERLEASRAVERVAGWLAEPDHAADLAARTADALVAGTDLLRDEDVHRVIVELLRDRIDKVALAPLAGRVLQQLTREGRHEPLLDAALAALSRYLAEHGSDLHHRLGLEPPWWLPGPLEDRLVASFLQRSEQVLDDMATHPDHPLRQQLDAGLEKLAADLQTSEDMRLRGEEIKAELLGHPEIRVFAAAVWTDLKVELRAQAERPGSELRTWLTALIMQTGARLRDDPALAASARRSLDTIVRTTLGRFDQELVTLVSGTIRRWDAVETSRRLELLLGPDLQFIRINGTIVGGLAGLVLHAVSVALA
jgi:uncharacterized membrane-anchored protein YjiN (DUF445 family)